MQKEEYQHTAYATNAYVTVGPLAMQVLQGNYPSFQIRKYAASQPSNNILVLLLGMHSIQLYHFGFSLQKSS